MTTDGIVPEGATLRGQIVAKQGGVIAGWDVAAEDTLASLQKNQYEIHIPEAIRVRVARAVERMIAIG